MGSITVWNERLRRYSMLDAEQVVLDHGKGIMIWNYDGTDWKMHRDIWTSHSSCQGKE